MSRDGNGQGTGNLPIEKNLPASAGIFFLRIASESEKVSGGFWKIFLGVLISQK